VAQVLTSKWRRQKENPTGEKHYVYSAGTTKDGLAILSKAKGDKGWDSFINEEVAENYGLDLGVIALPPSKFIEAQKAKREAKATEKATDKKANACNATQ